MKKAFSENLQQAAGKLEVRNGALVAAS
ncbi:uncharacterized protein METZ01_LOCUS29878 [marine metagenome]|uniref:Uncharacterized protein n=1 Tax=marine metagenome TaxID=408172 RepID=A0A381QDR9_9ZZZZ